ncbi:MAG: hypothetical protein K2H18_01300, partial [Muribaculaceae bacterium]|nr:hypothetical protein [Muribaculaceae bacterium]
PIILCDVMMVNDPQRRKDGKPEPFVERDPNDKDKFRTYYPLITNNNFDIGKPSNNKMRGYPIDTNDDVFLASGHTSSHYWYYSLAHESDCNGIEDIQFLTEKEKYDNYPLYTRRGSHARHGLSGLLVKERYVFVKFAPPKSSKYYDKTKIIKSFGLYDKHSDYDKKNNQPGIRIIASTAGAELPFIINEESNNRFYDYWNRDTENYLRIGQEQLYQGGGAVIHHKIYPVFSTKQLHTNRFSELNFNLKRWGEQK